MLRPLIILKTKNFFADQRTLFKIAKEILQKSLDASGVNTLKPRQNGRHFSDDSFKRIFLN